MSWMHPDRTPFGLARDGAWQNSHARAIEGAMVGGRGSAAVVVYASCLWRSLRCGRFARPLRRWRACPLRP
eukprot:753765-Pyramimonas_sp.AAC.1